MYMKFVCERIQLLSELDCKYNMKINIRETSIILPVFQN